MSRKRRVLFLQLPQLDNDVIGPAENVPVAAAHLEYAAAQTEEGRHHEFLRLPPALEEAGTLELVRHIAELQPDVLACTLYLWNIEWTLRLLAAIQNRLPGVRSVVGGPEVAVQHPFLYRAGVVHAAAVGEGENVFPGLLRAFRTGQGADYTTVAMRTRHGYSWGRVSPDPVDLATALPPPGHPACGPNARGMAYLEASRGCPMRCTYCRYPHLRRALSFLPPAAVVERIQALRRLGASEIRFTDPTFNSHPEFHDLLRRLQRLNRSHALRFFAELNADRLTEADADRLAAANFVDIEIGMQSRDPAVLRAIRRPTNLARLEQGVRLLADRGIKVTLDIMYGLPRQTLADLQHSMPWALRFRRVNVQCLQTLLLPGTELRSRHREWRMVSQRLPPYAVTATSTLPAADFATIERMIAAHPRLRSDISTSRFVARALPDLFAETVHVEAGNLGSLTTPPGQGNRRALLITGSNLFASRKAIARFVRRAVRAEPDALFQFVLVPAAEEPLDLLDALIAVLRACPTHLLDRYASASLHHQLAARRLFILLPRGRRFDRDWIAEAEELLATAFF